MTSNGSHSTKSVFSRWYGDVQRFFKTEGRPIVTTHNIPNETKSIQMSEIANQGTTAISSHNKLNDPKGREVTNSASPKTPSSSFKNSNNKLANQRTPKLKMKAPPPPTPEAKHIETLSENNLIEQKLSEIQTLKVEREETDDSEKSECMSWIEIQHDQLSETPDESSLTQDDDCSSQKIIPNVDPSVDPLTERYNALRSENKSHIQFKTLEKHNIDNESNRGNTNEFESFSLQSSKEKVEIDSETCKNRDIQHIEQCPAANSEGMVQQKLEDDTLSSSSNQTCQQLIIHHETKLINIMSSNNNSETGLKNSQQIEDVGLFPTTDDDHEYENWESIRSAISHNTEVVNTSENVSSLNNNGKKSQISQTSIKNSYHEQRITANNTNLLIEDIGVASSSYDQGTDNEEAIQNFIEIQFRSIRENHQNAVATRTTENVTLSNDSKSTCCTLPKSNKTNPDDVGSTKIAYDKKKSSTLPNPAKSHPVEDRSNKAHSIEVTKTTDHMCSYEKPTPLPKPTKYHHLAKRDHDTISRVISELTNNVSSTTRTQGQSVGQSIVKPNNQAHEVQDELDQGKSEQPHVESIVEKNITKIPIAETSQRIQTASMGEDEFVQNIIQKIRSIQQEVAEQENQICKFSGTTSDDRDYEYLDECLMRSLIKLDNFDIGNSLTAKEERRKGIRYIQGMLKKLDSKLKENQNKADGGHVVANMAKKWPENVEVDIAKDKTAELGQDEES